VPDELTARLGTEKAEMIRHQCPRCGSEPGQWCRSKGGRRTQHWHVTRWYVAVRARGETNPLAAEMEPVSYHVASEPRTWDELRADAVKAVMAAAADFGHDDIVSGSAAAFAEAVLAAINEETVTRMAATLVDEVRFRSMEIRAGRLEMTGIDAREIAATWVGAARELTKGAENYSETRMQFLDHEREQVYAFTVQKVGKRTPHEMRRQAEAERDEALAEVQRLTGTGREVPDGDGS